MPTELSVHAVHRGGMRIDAAADGRALEMDYPMPGGDGACAGLTPLQVLLASLAGCSGNTLALVLARMRQPVEAIEVEARGRRRDEHPTVLTDITLDFAVRGKGVDPAAVARALAAAEDQLCPVWAMLKPGVEIAASFTVIDD